MIKKIHILYTIPNFKTAGSQYVLLSLYKNIDRTLFKPFVLVERFPEYFPTVIREDERLYVQANVGKAEYINKMARLLREHQISVVHSWDYKSNSIEALACKLAGVAYLYTKKNNAWSKRWRIKSLLATHIAYDNPDMKERFFGEKFLSKKASFIPHGIDTSIFKPIPHKLSPKEFIVGSIGVLNENKNQILLLQALKELPAHVKAVFYGNDDKDYKKEMLSFVALHHLEERVSFKGFIKNEDIPSAMATFNCTVLASKSEGLPVSILEAMACGIPVLSSNSGGGARYLLEDGQGGYVFENDNSTALVEKLSTLESSPDLVVELGQLGLQRVKEHFTLAKEVASYQALYVKIVKH